MGFLFEQTNISGWPSVVKISNTMKPLSSADLPYRCSMDRPEVQILAIGD